MMRAALAWLIARIREIGHEHVYAARVLSVDRTAVVTIPTPFCATCGRYPNGKA
jgi:hypothetical protein